MRRDQLPLTCFILLPQISLSWWRSSDRSISRESPFAKTRPAYSGLQVCSNGMGSGCRRVTTNGNSKSYQLRCWSVLSCSFVASKIDMDEILRLRGWTIAVADNSTESVRYTAARSPGVNDHQGTLEKVTLDRERDLRLSARHEPCYLVTMAILKQSLTVRCGVSGWSVTGPFDVSPCQPSHHRFFLPVTARNQRIESITTPESSLLPKWYSPAR